MAKDNLRMTPSVGAFKDIAAVAPEVIPITASVVFQDFDLRLGPGGQQVCRC
jgi:hypothetical protein